MLMRPLAAILVSAMTLALPACSDADDPTPAEPDKSVTPDRGQPDAPAPATPDTPAETPDDPTKTGDGKEHEMQDTWSGTNGNIVEEDQRVVRDEAEWDKLWKHLHSNVDPTPERPDVDFAKWMVLAVFQGQRNSGGYAIEIVSVTEYPELIEAVYRETTPEPGAITTAALTAPYYMATVPRSDKDVRFVTAPDKD